MPSLIWLGVLAGAALLVSGCTEQGPTRPTSTTVAPADQCPSMAERVELGRPGQSGPPAEFTTSGANLYVSARGFLHGGPLDPRISITMVSVGPADKPPTWDQQRNLITNLQEQVEVREGQLSLLRLPAGRYWLWTSNTVSITLESCQAGNISAVRPVP